MSRQSQKTKRVKFSWGFFFRIFSSCFFNPLGHDNSTSPPPPDPFRTHLLFFFSSLLKKNFFHTNSSASESLSSSSSSTNSQSSSASSTAWAARSSAASSYRWSKEAPSVAGSNLCGFSFLPLWRCNYREKRWTTQKMLHGGAKDHGGAKNAPWRCKRCSMEVQKTLHGGTKDHGGAKDAPWRCKRRSMEVQKTMEVQKMLHGGAKDAPWRCKDAQWTLDNTSGKSSSPVPSNLTPLMCSRRSLAVNTSSTPTFVKNYSKKRRKKTPGNVLLKIEKETTTHP